MVCSAVFESIRASLTENAERWTSTMRTLSSPSVLHNGQLHHSICGSCPPVDHSRLRILVVSEGVVATESSSVLMYQVQSSMRMQQKESRPRGQYFALARDPPSLSWFSFVQIILH